ncbi:hypothetical protein A2982_04180 [candidate division WWE3 bacterium RIFCSPLOWO2_01_FULL_39_13]|uniref:HIT domain-containing protein n=1 Tax=candidate division WWE3 bacterium RIFCSPLOWO2_01_FULL_39_13 TaxID=1802624 RepID=A0A1F4V274_UNCKA|nr:MAG: hypothetical protein A2982_04180 [candidate division WWE3 bacterium RIFCSPLOWO2_01_FULL_39_13]
MPDYSNYNARTYESYSEIWKNTGKCVFCDLKDKYIITEKDGVVLTVNLFPYIDGHLLIIPRRHFENFEDADKIEWEATKTLADIGEKLIKKFCSTEGVWFLFRLEEGFKSQKTVAHAHAHLIPYSPKLFKWEFQKVEFPPEEFAKELRSGLK